MPASTDGNKYPPLTPQEDAAELGVPLTQQLQPNLKDNVPNRFVQLEEAKTRGWSMYWDGQACRFGHQAARYVANPRRCSGCDRERKQLPQIYPTSKAGTFYTPERVANSQAAKTGPAAPVTPSAPREPSKQEQRFLEALATGGDFDSAAQNVGMTRGRLEARASVDPVFKAALTDLCERHSIPWTRTPDPQAFKWTTEIERQLMKRYVDLGLIEAARNELGIAASDYQDHLRESPAFANMIEDARPRARITLRERAEAAADKGNDRLLKILADEALEDDEYMVLVNGQRVPRPIDPDKAVAELSAMLATLTKEHLQREALGVVSRELTTREPIAKHEDLLDDTPTDC